MIIPILHCEKSIQVGDLIRFDATRSISVKGSNPITTVSIKPGMSEVAIPVTGTSKDWFLDYAYNEVLYDIDDTLSRIVFKYNGATFLTDIAEDTYTLTELMDEVRTKIGALVPSLILAYSIDDNRLTLNSSSPLELLASRSALFDILGITKTGELGLPLEHGIRKVTLRVESSTENAEQSLYIRTYSVEGDALFSDDSDLLAFESDIMKWLPAGRSSYKDLHRKAQAMILDYMDRQGYVDENNHTLTKWAFVDNSDVRMWSTFLVLRLFYMSIRNSTDDVFRKKAAEYEKEEIAARNRTMLNIDTDGDGAAETLSPGPDAWSGRLNPS